MSHGDTTQRVQLVEISLGVRPTEVRKRVRRLEHAGGAHWLLRRVAATGYAYATPEEAEELADWLISAEAPLEMRRHISNALVSVPVELRAGWRIGRPSGIVVTLN